MALVLCTGADEELMAVRKLVLERAGHHVVSVTGESELVAACRQNSFEVAIIAQTVHRNEKHRILTLLREHCPKVKVLELVERGAESTLQGVDDCLQVPEASSAELPERVSKLAG